MTLFLGPCQLDLGNVSRKLFDPNLKKPINALNYLYYENKARRTIGEGDKIRESPQNERIYPLKWSRVKTKIVRFNSRMIWRLSTTLQQSEKRRSTSKLWVFWNKNHPKRTDENDNQRLFVHESPTCESSALTNVLRRISFVLYCDDNTKRWMRTIKRRL